MTTIALSIKNANLLVEHSILAKKKEKRGKSPYPKEVCTLKEISIRNDAQFYYHLKTHIIYNMVPWGY